MSKRRTVQKANWGEVAANAARMVGRLSEEGGLAGRVGRGLSGASQKIRGLGEGIREFGQKVRRGVADVNPFNNNAVITSTTPTITRTPAQYVGTPEEYLRRNAYDMQANGIGGRVGSLITGANPFGDEAMSASFLQGLMGTPEEYARRHALPQNPNPYGYGTLGPTFPRENRKAGVPRFSRSERKANQYRGVGRREASYYPSVITGQDPLTITMVGDTPLYSRPIQSNYKDWRNAIADLEYNDGKSPYRSPEYPDDPNFPWSQAYRDTVFPPDAAPAVIGRGLNPNWKNVGVPVAPKPVNRRPTSPSGRGYRGINRINSNIAANPLPSGEYLYTDAIRNQSADEMNAYEQRRLALPENSDIAYYRKYLDDRIARVKKQFPHYSDFYALGSALRDPIINARGLFSPEQLKEIALQYSKEMYTNKNDSFHLRHIESLFPQYKDVFYSAKTPQVVEPLVIKPRGRKTGLNSNWADLNGGLGKSMGKRNTINKFMDNSFAKSMSKPASTNRSIKSSNKYFN